MDGLPIVEVLQESGVGDVEDLTGKAVTIGLIGV